MKTHKYRITDSLAFRVVAPVIATIIVMWFVLYVFVLRSVSGFADIQVKESLEGMSQDLYGMTGFMLFSAASLLLLYLHKTIRRPLDSIIEPMKKEEYPDYKGIYEFEFLSDTIRGMMESVQRETKMLNNIYHIAASKRGEDFFGEVAMAIGRMFGLNSLIARVGPDEIADVAAFYYGGELKKGMHISLRGTPCEGVVRKKHMVVIERDLYKQFPLAAALTAIKADAYIGFAVFNRKSEVIGIVNAFGKQRDFTESDIKVLHTVGQMVAAEFERLDEEGEKELMRGQLYQAQKMEAIGTLAGGVAHDFNNMLQGILGYASLLKMDVSESDPMYKPLDIIEHSAQKASELTKQLLGFARKGKYSIEPLNLNDVVEDVVRIVTRTFDRAIVIEKTLKEDLWTTEADRSQIEHAILNLCLNARDAMLSGGVLRIETSNREISGKQEDYPWLKEGRYAVMKISDTGMGMDAGVKEHIFEPFFTTKEKGKGTGMGLAMVYGVVKNHGGFITVDSEIGKGATFTVLLPSVEKDVTGKRTEMKKPLHGRGTVLVVDDEGFIRDFAGDTLQKLGYRVFTASDGREAIELYTSRKGEIDLVILDLIMPVMRGTEVFERLKTVNPDVKVLISSGYGGEAETGNMTNDKRVAGIIHKPYTITELAEAVKRVLPSTKKT